MRRCRLLFAAVLGTAHAIRQITAPRRRFLHSTAWLPAALIAPPAHAATEKSAIFSGGAAPYLQPFFDEIRYKGVTRIEVGRVDDAANTRALRVFYNADKCSYKALLGVYWRHVDPTRNSQFPLDASEEGDAFRGVIWVSDAEERKLAEQSMTVMADSGVYGKNRRFLTEIAAVPSFTPVPEDGQNLYIEDAKAYEKVLKKSGRAKFFEQAYRPITTTACKEKTCGYVYFPCSDENGCTGVVSGMW
jgi:peptide methionine sulfoxide reductase MsrA